MPGPPGLAVIRPAAYLANNGGHKCRHIEYNAREGTLRATSWMARLLGLCLAGYMPPEAATFIFWAWHILPGGVRLLYYKPGYRD